MELWDREAMDPVEPAMIEFARNGIGTFPFTAVPAGLDYRGSEQDRERVEFSWEAFDEDTSVRGRGWALVEDDATLSGRNSQELWMRFLGAASFRTSTAVDHLLFRVTDGMRASWSASNRSLTAIGSSQHGHSAPGPSRRHHVLQSSQRCWPR
jgi:hypothetical protein